MCCDSRGAREIFKHTWKGVININTRKRNAKKTKENLELKKTEVKIEEEEEEKKPWIQRVKTNS